MISHHHKCVFVHIPKNAGQSIEHVFLDLLGLTWETRAPLLLRHNDRPELGPAKLAHLKWWEYVDHKYMTQAQFDEYFKFTFVRNPWSRVVSMYKYFGFHRNTTFKDFVMKDFQTGISSKFPWFTCAQSEFICDGHDCLKVDFVGRVENLQGDFEHVCLKLGLPPIKVRHLHASREQAATTKKSATPLLAWFGRRRKEIPSFPSFKDYYDDEVREVVAKLYERDIRLFNYSFNDT
jgi:hypothetical protein